MDSLSLSSSYPFLFLLFPPFSPALSSLLPHIHFLPICSPFRKKEREEEGEIKKKGKEERKEREEGESGNNCVYELYYNHQIKSKWKEKERRKVKVKKRIHLTRFLSSS